jgi:hypothetical protein
VAVCGKIDDDSWGPFAFYIERSGQCLYAYVEQHLREFLTLSDSPFRLIYIELLETTYLPSQHTTMPSALNDWGSEPLSLKVVGHNMGTSMDGVDLVHVLFTQDSLHASLNMKGQKKSHATD